MHEDLVNAAHHENALGLAHGSLRGVGDPVSEIGGDAEFGGRGGGQCLNHGVSVDEERKREGTGCGR